MDRSKEQYTERGSNSTQKEHTSSSLCDDERDTIELNLVDDSSFMLPHRQRLHRRCHGLTLEKKKVVSDVSKYIYICIHIHVFVCVYIYIHIHYTQYNIYIHTYMCVCIHTQTYLHIYMARVYLLPNHNEAYRENRGYGRIRFTL